MPTRKQRRRQAKDRRHEYEYVYVDDQGQEVEVEDDEPEQRSAKATPAKAGVRPNAKSPKPAGKSAARKQPVGREVKPPSWDRVLRRGLIFAPIMLVVVYLLKPASATPASIIVQVVVLLLFFLPFSYLMDTVMYRQYRKRIGDPLPPRGSKPKT